jgi:hypothetical protein
LSGSGRQKLARLDAQVETQTRAAEAARLDASRLQAAMLDAEAAETRAIAALDTIDRDLIEIDKNLALATASTSDEETEARSALDRAMKTLESAEVALAECNKLAGDARDAAIQATTRVEAARTRAREFDTSGVWTTALADGSHLVVDNWSLASTVAEQGQSDAKTAVADAAQRLDEVIKQRAEAIKQARALFVMFRRSPS